jgi:uncharacterized coiled-coil DUF342 family protein
MRLQTNLQMAKEMMSSVSYKKQLQLEIKEIQRKIDALYAELKTVRSSDPRFDKIYQRINELSTTRSAKKDRIEYIDRYPAHMPTHDLNKYLG